MIKPLEWSGPTKPNDSCRYYHVRAVTPFGALSIEWKSWKDHDSMDIHFDGEFIMGGAAVSIRQDAEQFAASLSEAKEVATAWWQSKLRDCLSVITANKPLGIEDALDALVLPVQAKCDEYHKMNQKALEDADQARYELSKRMFFKWFDVTRALNLAKHELEQARKTEARIKKAAQP